MEANYIFVQSLHTVAFTQTTNDVIARSKSGVGDRGRSPFITVALKQSNDNKCISISDEFSLCLHCGSYLFLAFIINIENKGKYYCLDL